MKYRNIKPTWLELQNARLVYYSPILRERVISRRVLDELLHVLRSEYNLVYTFPNDKHQLEITQREYETILQYTTESFSTYFEIICYEEPAKEQEIRQQIIRKLKNK